MADMSTNRPPRSPSLDGLTPVRMSYAARDAMRICGSVPSRLIETVRTCGDELRAALTMGLDPRAIGAEMPDLVAGCCPRAVAS